MINPLPRRPLVGLALAFVIGTALGLRHDMAPGPFLGLGAGLTLATVLSAWCAPLARGRHGPAVGAAAVFLAMACLGMINARLSVVPDSAPTLCAADAGKTVVIKATLTDEPMPAATRAGGEAYRFPVAVTAIRSTTNAPWRAASGALTIRWFGSPARIPGYGEEWQWTGRLTTFVPPQPTGPPGSKPRPAYFSFTTTAQDGERLSVGHGNPLVTWCLHVRTACVGLLTAGIRDFPETVGILTSLVLGCRSQIATDLYQAFAATGTLHVFAVSGSHVVVIAAAIVFVLSACGMPRTRWVLLLAPALIGYTILTGLQPSAVRACVMGVSYAAAPLLNRRTDLYGSLGLSALLILAVDPADLDNAGCILSFAAVIGLGLFYPVFMAPMQHRLKSDPLQLVPDPRWKQLVHAGLHYVAGLMAMSMAAWVATLPLTAWYFGQFSPIGLFGNLTAVPLAEAILITGIISLAGGSVTPILADLFNHANLVFASLMAGSIRIFAAVPYGHIYVPAPPFLAVAAWYAAILVWRFYLWVKNPSPAPDGAVAPDVRLPSGKGRGEGRV